MNDAELWAKMYEQKHAEINGRNVWHYLISTAIGNIHVVEFELESKELIRTLFDEDNDKAEKYFNYTCKKIIDGKI